MPLHYIQHNYCGPFTTDYSAEAVSELDECCRTHDLHYENPYIHTQDADSQLIDCLQQTGTTSGALIGGIIQVKQAIDVATNYASDVMLRPGNKRRHELEQQKCADKRAKGDSEQSEGGGGNIDNNNNDNNQNNMADHDMGEPAVGPSDVIAGSISGGDITASGGDTSDHDMGEPAVGPSDVIAGSTSGGDITASGGDTSDHDMGEPAVGPSDVIAGSTSGGDITASGGGTRQTTTWGNQQWGHQTL